MNWLWELQMVQQPMEMVAIPELIFITLHLHMKQASIPVQQQLLIQICQGFHLYVIKHLPAQSGSF